LQPYTNSVSAVNAMATQTYNTRISLIKAGKVISRKITISLIMIWAALIIAAIFLLISNGGFSLMAKDADQQDHIKIFSAGQTEKQTAEGAFVFVVRNKKMVLTRYTAYIDNNQPDIDLSAEPDIAVTNNPKTATAVVRHPKSNHQKQSAKTDFSVKRVPFQ
jgi:hypothetical protein